MVEGTNEVRARVHEKGRYGEHCPRRKIKRETGEEGQRGDRDENRREEERKRARYGEGCGSGPLIISGDWPTGPTTAATWLDERTLRCTR